MPKEWKNRLKWALRMNRRTFLKIASMGSVAFAAGCSADSKSNLYTMVEATEDMVTGKATWYASTCRECPAGCGVLAKNREGRVIKLEGNPLHPVNQGSLCMRGQAALQGHYNPDRLMQPQLKTKDGWKEISFYDAKSLIRQKVETAYRGGHNRVAMMTETVGQAQLDVFTSVLQQLDSAPPFVFEPFAYESVKFAYRQLFGKAILPVLHMDKADFLLGFGADFLETWLSPVEYARKFKAMHGYGDGRKGLFIQVSPFQTLTAANADRWVSCRPGSEAAILLGLVKGLATSDYNKKVNQKVVKALSGLLENITPDGIAELSGVSASDQAMLVKKLAEAKHPLVLGAGACGEGAQASATEMAVLLLNLVLDSDLTLFDFNNRHRVEIADTRAAILDAFASLEKDKTAVVFLNNVNPVYAMPGNGKIAESLASDSRFTVAFANFMDETASIADLVFPVQMALETWDAYESNSQTLSTLQPAMGKITQAPSLGDVMLDLAPVASTEDDSYLARVTQTVLQGKEKGDQTSTRWLQTIQRGGRFAAEKSGRTPKPNLRALGPLKAYVEAFSQADEAIVLLTPPSIRFFDGRGANRPWLIETPDTLTQIPWQTTMMVHPDTMASEGLEEGDLVTLATDTDEIEVPAYATTGIFPGAVAVSVGQGHTVYGRWASDQGVNPTMLLSSEIDENSGAPFFSGVLKVMQKTGRRLKLATTSGSRVAYNRKIAPTVALDQIGQKHAHHKEGLTMDSFPLTPPIPEGYDPKRDLYPPHDHDGYRWAMIVDMDRCIGCSACVAACYAENNIGIVGEERIIEGREMAWLQIQRYHDPADMTRLTFLPMMCQHCDNAPCEAVCPVYAPHHNKEGLNNQIYNRCIGTRYCAQNCPYKVRRFNWFNWSWPKPLDMQLNPNVTVRIAGVMEKCSFCIQRIKTAHNVAKNEKRAIRDGEVIPACVQTCPTHALTFGSLMEKESRVSQMIKDPRAYQVMGYLNTKPAVIYLKKVTQTV